jgi:hypothetical protein
MREAFLERWRKQPIIYFPTFTINAIRAKFKMNVAKVRIYPTDEHKRALSGFRALGGFEQFAQCNK